MAAGREFCGWSILLLAPLMCHTGLNHGATEP